MDIAAACRWLDEYFNEHDLDFAVIGGFALIALGIERATFDLDLVTLRSGQDELIAELEGRGYETLYRSSGFSNHLHADATLGRIDVVYVGQETGRQIFAGASRREILTGVLMPVPRPEHLAAMKVHALKSDPGRRHSELVDIAHLLRLPAIDKGEIAGYFERSGLQDLYRQVEAGQADEA